MNQIRIAGIKSESIVDGPGIRLVVFSQGCPHSCVGCHNPESHDISGGRSLGIEEIIREIKSNPLLDGISLSGGEPFLQAEKLSILNQRVKALGLNTMTYTGYRFEEIVENRDRLPGWQDLLRFSDILVDGRFILAQRNPMLAFKGSENQRIIDVKKSLEKGRVIIRRFEEENIDWGA